MARILIIDDDARLRRKVRALLEAAEHQVTEAADGQEGLTRLHECNPQGILLDFVMPKMNGYQFCGALRSIANHRDTPVVLISARTDKVGERFIRKFGVSDAISKPFDDDTLLAVVENTITDSPPQERSSPARLPLVDSIAEEPDPEESIAAAASLIARMVVRDSPDLASRLDEITTRLAAGLDDEHLSDRVELLANLERIPGSPALSGELSVVSLPDMMQLLAMQRQTGALEVSSGNAAVTIQLREGKIELAVASGVRQEFLLGRYLVEEELVSRQDLDLLLRNRTGTRLLGDQLVKLDYITVDELSRVLTRQTSDILFEVLRWTEGRFRFQPGVEIPGATEAVAQLEVIDIVMEALRRVDEWRLIEQEIPELDMRIAPSSDAGKLFDTSRFSEEELYLLDLIDDETTVREIVDQTAMGSFQACRILYRLISMKLIRQVS